MKIKLLNGEELELVNSFRVFMYFEEIAQHSLDFSNLTSNDLLILFYSVFISSLQKAKKSIITYLEFLDIIDENGGDRCVLEFTNFYIDLIKKQYSVLEDMQEEKQDDEPKDDSKKKN